MTTITAERIAELLIEQYNSTPVLTWWDAEAEYGDEIDAIALLVQEHGVDLVVHRVAGNELGVKHRLYEVLDEENSMTRQLVYRTGERPVIRANWLFDIEVSYGLFSADTTTLLVRELGLEGRGVDKIIAEYATVFAAVDRSRAVKDHLELVSASLTDEQLPGALRAVMAAAVAGVRSTDASSLRSLVIALFEDHTRDRTVRYDALTKFGLAKYFWRDCESTYGYVSNSPTVAGLITWLFDEAWRGWPAPAKPAAQIDFERLQADRSHHRLFAELAERAQDDLNIADQLSAYESRIDELAGTDIFPVIDRAIIRLLSKAMIDQTQSAGAVAAVVRKRSATTWFDDHRNSYRALVDGSDLIARTAGFSAVFADSTAAVENYANHWWMIDRAYRSFRRHVVLAEDDLPGELGMMVEKRYVNTYQRPLAEAWQTQVDAMASWSIPGVAPLGRFACDDLPARAKTLVIISDALRYEVGAELAERINGDDWFSATVEPRLAPLPSYTQLGMASHLPHERLKLADNSNVLADGVSTAGLASRSELWKKINVAALSYSAATEMPSDELGAIWSEHDAVVVYHDVIDAAGDKAASELSTPDACSRAIDEIINLAKKFGRGKTRASRVLITTDHGFLFQNSELDPADFLSESAHGDEILKLNRRFVLGRGLRDHPSFTMWSSAQLGLDGDLQVQIPRALHRLRLPGWGTRFVHGGATLQEVVVPLITLTQSRAKDTSKVNVELNTSSPNITSSTVIATLTQREPITGRLRGRTLSVAVWAGDGTLLSNERALDVDSTSDDIRDRQNTIELVLSGDAERYNGQTVQIRADEISHGTRTTYKSTTATLQRGFGGFFDPL
jgi:uncharacterized protein (TIGR02687 family)